MLRFCCPSCGKTLKAPESKVGAKLPCPSCRTSLHVPPPVRERPLLPEAATPHPVEADEQPEAAHEVAGGSYTPEIAPPPVRGAGPDEEDEEAPEAPEPQCDPADHDGPRQPSRKEWLPVWLSLAVLYLLLGLAAWLIIRDDAKETEREAFWGVAEGIIRNDLLSAQLALAAAKAKHASFCRKVISEFVAVALVLTVLMVWMARDAKARGVRIWSALPAFVPLTGGLFFVGYLVGRPPGYLAPCARCGGRLLALAETCPHCAQSKG